MLKQVHNNTNNSVIQALDENHAYNTKGTTENVYKKTPHTNENTSHYRRSCRLYQSCDNILSNLGLIHCFLFGPIS